MSDKIFQNPFNITKAVDFSDAEINKYWVELTGENGGGFFQIVKPLSPMPMLILGGKGSGKTHIMRYFSFQLQKMRAQKNNLLDEIKKDKYIGIYFRCGAINAGRFQGKGFDDEVWAPIFQFWMELWFGQLLLGVLTDLVRYEIIDRDLESAICADILQLFDHLEDDTLSSFAELMSYLTGVQKHVDYIVNNCVIQKNIHEINITITRGKFIFGLPKIITDKVLSLDNPLIVFLIDEFENLSTQQQIYINTLYREKEPPCTFKIGARLYGIKTYSTYSGDEKNKEGSEFEKVVLDELLRKQTKQYKNFSKRLIVRRMRDYQYSLLPLEDEERAIEVLPSLFENISYDNYNVPDIVKLAQKFNDSVKPYFSNLKKSLQKIRVPEEEQSKIIDLLSCPQYLLLEKLNLFHFYKRWSMQKDDNLLDSAILINRWCKKLISDSEETAEYLELYKHFKFDLIAQIRREFKSQNRTIAYVGIDNCINMSMGLPRNLLILLKQIYAWANFNGEDVFNKPISINSQQQGINEASEWFFKETKMIWEEGKKIQDSIARLGLFFKRMRFSDKPVECSLSTFSYDPSQISDEAAKILKFAQRWSLLIQVGTQKDRNSSATLPQIQINRLLAPKWELPISRRGVISLGADEINAIFDSTQSDNFQNILLSRLARMTAPFGQSPKPSKEAKQNKLF